MLYFTFEKYHGWGGPFRAKHPEASASTVGVLNLGSDVPALGLAWLSVSSCVTSGRSHNLSEPRFSSQ